MNRRNFLRLGIGAAIAAPALVSRANIMAVRVPRRDPLAAIWSDALLRKFEQATQFGENVMRDYEFAIDLGRPGGDATVVARRWRTTDGGIMVADIVVSDYGVPGMRRRGIA